MWINLDHIFYPTTDFPTWESDKGTKNPQGIWLWRLVGFEYRSSTELGKQELFEGTNKILCAPGPRRKEQWPHKRLTQMQVYNWPQVNNREETQPHPSTENWIKVLLSMAPPIRTRPSWPSFPVSHSLPSRSFYKPLILPPQKAEELKTTITEN